MITMADLFKDSLEEMELNERITLGILLIQEDAIKHAIKKHRITKNHFFFAHTRAIFRAIESLFNKTDKVTVREVCLELVDSREVKETDGLIEIAEILELGEKITAEKISICELAEYLEDAYFFRSHYFMSTRYEAHEDLSHFKNSYL